MLSGLEQLATAGKCKWHASRAARWLRRSKCVIGRAHKPKSETRGSTAIREEITEPEDEGGCRVEPSLGRRFRCFCHSQAGRFSCSRTTQQFDGRVGLGIFRA